MIDNMIIICIFASLYSFLMRPLCLTLTAVCRLITVLLSSSYLSFFFSQSLQSVGPNSLMFIRNLLDKLASNQQNILKFIACNEIFLMPATVFMLFRQEPSIKIHETSLNFLLLWDKEAKISQIQAILHGDVILGIQQRFGQAMNLKRYKEGS